MSALAVKQMAGQEKQELPAPTADVRKENILLVDDRPANLLVYKNILEELDQNLVSANSGEEALKLVLKQEFAVILLDVNMPTMSGFETASLIRQRKKSSRTPIIFLTAFTDEMNINQGYASGAVDFLPTPIVPEVLKAKVRVFIELSQTRRQAALQAEERARREAAEESARKSKFLVKVSESLTRSLNQGELLQALVRLPLPDLADVSLAWLKAESGHAECTEWGQVMPAESEGEEKPPELADFPWLEPAMQKVMATGQMQHIEQLPAPQALGAALLFPLVIQGKVRGVLMTARKIAQPYSFDDISMAADLAQRACTALENIMLVETIREADRRKDEFLGMLAHELRNPLGPICNAIQLLKMLGPQEKRVTEIREIIDRQARHMGRLIDDLLDATRLAHGKILLRKESCNLAGIIRQTAEDYRTILETNNLRLQITCCDEPVWVDGDPTRLVQAVGNLLHNANKFTRPGGTITVELEKDPLGHAVITVTDTGIGIESDMLPFVFDVFRQAEQGLDRNQGGLGLGLALVKGLIHLHGGDVAVASEGLNMGARFTLRLPTEAKTEKPAPGAEVVPFPKNKKQRILVIEDNKDAAASAEMLLNLEGHEVRTAGTALTGLDAARQFRPEIVLCDIGLPEMDGYQIVRTIRQDPKLRSIYVIALTGYGREEDQRQALEAGFDLHLTKPIDYKRLCDAIALAGMKASHGS